MEVNLLFGSSCNESAFIMFVKPQILMINPVDQLRCFLLFCELRFLRSSTCFLALSKVVGCCFDKIFFCIFANS